MRHPIAALTLTLFGLAGPGAAAPVGPSTHLGLATGGHLVVTGWETELTDAQGQHLSPEGNGLFRVRLGRQFNGWVGAEVSAAYMPLAAEEALATGFIYDGDLLITLREAPVMPLLVLGGGAYHVVGSQGDSDLDWQFHYGFSLRGTINQRLAVRGGLRHIFADSLEPDQDLSNHIELTVGFDILFGADPG